MRFQRHSQASLGVVPEKVRVRFKVRTAFSKGEVGMLDMALSDADVDNFRAGSATSAFANMINPSTNGTKFPALLGVADEDIADNGEGYFVLQGVVDALVIKSSGNIAAGDPLVATTDGNLDAELAADEKVVGIAMEAATGPNTATLKQVLFDGICGFGTEGGS